MLNVQRTLETRYPDFFERHKRTARTLSRFLGFLFYESRFQNFAEEYPHLEGFDFIDQVLRYFDFDLRLTESERARIPASGRVVIAANHPIGSLDGLALLHLVRSVRPDVKVVANDLLTAIDPLHPVLLPVVNMGGGTGTARNALLAIREHLNAEGALIIFPAGEVSRLGPKGVKDCEWQSGFVKLASSTRSPILPVYVAGRNSLFFYSLSALAKPLSTIWLVREMFKQSHNTVDARIGRPVPFEVYSGKRLLGAAAGADVPQACVPPRLPRQAPSSAPSRPLRPRKTACSCARNWPRRRASGRHATARRSTCAAWTPPPASCARSAACAS
jgi:1-acyl-sn-glycerol-3-phosphate acyltransferase